ncbi:MAG: hypothetical protein U0Q12_25360 [Vicinamibacterales bacterium]
MVLSSERHNPRTCHWSIPTLFMPSPYWTSAWDRPWTCWNALEVRVLESGATCRDCPLWKARLPNERAGGWTQPEGSLAMPDDGRRQPAR